MAGLRAIHGAHIQRIPFENLDVVWKQKISLHPADLANKILLRARGGGCYELHGLLVQFLKALGFGAHLLSGQHCRQDGSLSEPDDHVAIFVSLDRPTLVDVSFAGAVRAPIDLASDSEDIEGALMATEAEGGWCLARIEEGVRKPQFLVHAPPRLLSSFLPALRRHEAPDQPFSRETIVRVATEGLDRSLRGDQLTFPTESGLVQKTVSPSELPAVLENQFGIRI
jgi:N-hydroxyarylamine O-acetyltransferase